MACSYSHVAVRIGPTGAIIYLPLPVMFKHPTTLTTIPLELIDHVLSFLSWPNDIYSILFTNKFLNPIAERSLYRNIGDLPAQRAVRLLLSLANAPAARCALVKSLSLDFSDNRVLFALELLIARVLRLLPRLRSLNVEVSIHENRHRALAWIFPGDAPFRLLSFATSIRFMSFLRLLSSSLCDADWPLPCHVKTRPRFSDLPRVSARDPRPLITRYTRIYLGPLHDPTIRTPAPRELPLSTCRPRHPWRGKRTCP